MTASRKGRRSHIPNPTTSGRHRHDQQAKARKREQTKKSKSKYIWKNPGGAIRTKAEPSGAGQSIYRQEETDQLLSNLAKEKEKHRQRHGVEGYDDDDFDYGDFYGGGNVRLKNEDWDSDDDELDDTAKAQWSRLFNLVPDAPMKGDPDVHNLAQAAAPKTTGAYYIRQRDFYRAFEDLLSLIAYAMATGAMPHCPCGPGDERPFKVYCIDILCKFFHLHFSVKLTLRSL